MYCGSLFVSGKGFTMEIPPSSLRREEFVCGREYWVRERRGRRVEAVEGSPYFRAEDDVEKRAPGMGRETFRQTFSPVLSSE